MSAKFDPPTLMLYFSLCCEVVAKVARYMRSLCLDLTVLGMMLLHDMEES